MFGYICVCPCGCLCVSIAGGFRLKYAASHISEAFDNADWRRSRRRRRDEDFLWSRYHGDSPLFFPPRQSVWEQRTKASVCFRKGKQKNLNLPRAQWTKPQYSCLRKKNMFPWRWRLVSRTQNIPRDSWSLPFPFVFWYFCTEGWKLVTYYIIIRKLTDFWGNFFCLKKSRLKTVFKHFPRYYCSPGIFLSDKCTVVFED